MYGSKRSSPPPPGGPPMSIEGGCIIPIPPPPMSAEVMTELEEELDDEYVIEDFVLPSGLSVVAAITYQITKDLKFSFESIHPFLRELLHYVTNPCDIGTHDSLITFTNGLGPLKTKSGGGFPGRG